MRILYGIGPKLGVEEGNAGKVRAFEPEDTIGIAVILYDGIGQQIENTIFFPRFGASSQYRVNEFLILEYQVKGQDLSIGRPSQIGSQMTFG